jgi:hypothetical protein
VVVFDRVVTEQELWHTAVSTAAGCQLPYLIVCLQRVVPQALRQGGLSMAASQELTRGPPYLLSWLRSCCAADHKIWAGNVGA